jgi:predicted TIM-barrel fold metal-dependent hydrolase
MIIDCHAHLVAPDSLYAYRSLLLSGAGHIEPALHMTDDDLRPSVEHTVRLMDEVGTDIQLLSPRPFHQMHSARPESVVQRWIRTNNDVIAQTCRLSTRFLGVAGLPLCAGADVESCFSEFDRAIDDLGFVGVSLNPDPWEGKGYTPLLGDRFWYPLYERASERQVPILIHSAGCENGRESYADHFMSEAAIAALSLARSAVLAEFPDLQIVIPHGAGSVPYQIGRWEAERLLPALGGDPGTPPLVESLQRLWFDTVLHRQESLELLFKVVTPSRCLFGTERPGSGSSIDRQTGRPFDDIKSTLEGMTALTDQDREAIFSMNPLRVFPRASERLGAVR